MLGVVEGEGVREHEALLALHSLLHPSATPAIQAWQQARYTPLSCTCRFNEAHSSLMLTGRSAVPNTVCRQLCRGCTCICMFGFCCCATSLVNVSNCSNGLHIEQNQAFEELPMAVWFQNVACLPGLPSRNKMRLHGSSSAWSSEKKKLML